ncbi:MAG: hypothetical protein H0T42_34515 [Deltaproteobacteria bacterium]|nr:hypothetical protein [Deltaproteobacteria bacterium]
MKAALLALLAILALAGCLPTLAAQSAAPPSRSARLDSIDGFWGPKGYRLELSQGVAIALTCNRGGPCTKLRVTADDPSIAEVRQASLSRLEVVGLHGNQQQASALVVIGKAPGSTKIRVRTGDVGQDIHVTIVAPPITNPQTAVTR